MKYKSRTSKGSEIPRFYQLQFKLHCQARYKGKKKQKKSNAKICWCSIENRDGSTWLAFEKLLAGTL